VFGDLVEVLADRSPRVLAFRDPRDHGVLAERGEALADSHDRQRHGRASGAVDATASDVTGAVPAPRTAAPSVLAANSGPRTPAKPPPEIYAAAAMTAMVSTVRKGFLPPPAGATRMVMVCPSFGLTWCQ